MKRSLVSIVKTTKCTYPTADEFFRPSQLYPEVPFAETSRQHNGVYDAVRESLFLLGLDQERYGTEMWNPLESIIKPGNTVLLKPNLVMDVNRLKEEGAECLYTQPAVVAAVIDYVVIALQGTGRIIIGDAPMQECNFKRLVSESGYLRLIDFYRNKGIAIELVDFRELTSIVVNGVHHSSINEHATGRIVDLGEWSEFYGCSKSDYQKMRVTNYDPRIMNQHHNEDKNEYYISDYILNADVIINMPKPKTHRKAGATISLKNMVGANVRKEFLPHHTIGATSEGGDEYNKKNMIQKVRSYMCDKRNVLQAEKHYVRAHLCKTFIRICSGLLKCSGNKYIEGSWYGNHTISRTIADLNKIILYADKDGQMQDNPQRHMIIIADMIVSGEKEGPVLPTAKPVGIIAAGLNPVCFDEAIATLMGFDVLKIPTICKARQISDKYSIVESHTRPMLVSNVTKYHNKEIEQLGTEDVMHFEPSSGWKGHIELSKE